MLGSVLHVHIVFQQPSALRWFHKDRLTPAPFVKPPFTSLVFWLLSSLALSLLVSWVLLFGCSHHRVHSNTNRSIAWASMLSSSSALEHERYNGLGMDALVTVCSWNRTVTMSWAWMLLSLSAVEHDRYYGLGMDAFIMECNRTRSLLWFWHGCSHH